MQRRPTSTVGPDSHQNRYFRRVVFCPPDSQPLKSVPRHSLTREFRDPRQVRKQGGKGHQRNPEGRIPEYQCSTDDSEVGNVEVSS